MRNGNRQRLTPREMETQTKRLQGLFRRDFIAGAVPGVMLPSFNELAERYAVSLAVARKFYERLEADGVVRAEPRKGFFLQAPERFQPTRRPVLIGLLGYEDPACPDGQPTHIHQLLERLANQHGWRARAFNPFPKLTLGMDIPLEMAKARLDAAFLFSAPNPCEQDVWDALRQLGIPLLSLESSHEGVLRVGYDNRQIGRLAAAHLLETGHREIAYALYSPRQDWMEEREEGFRQAGGGTMSLQVDLMAPESCRDCVRELVARGVTAVFCANDKMALALLQAGLDPRDIAVVGVDDSPESRSRDLSTVQKFYVGGVEAAFRALVDYFDNGVPLPQRVDLPGTLLVRGSTAAALV